LIEISEEEWEAGVDKQLDKAIELIKKALSDNPENAAYLDSLGWAYYKLAKEDDGKLKI